MNTFSPEVKYGKSCPNIEWTVWETNSNVRTHLQRQWVPRLPKFRFCPVKEPKFPCAEPNTLDSAHETFGHTSHLTQSGITALIRRWFKRRSYREPYGMFKLLKCVSSQFSNDECAQSEETNVFFFKRAFPSPSHLICYRPLNSVAFIESDVHVSNQIIALVDLQ